MGCRICADERRVEIEGAVDEAGADLFRAAERFGVTRAALVKHKRCPRAPQGDPASPMPEPPRAMAAPAPARGTTSRERAPISEDESPATSRSEEIRATSSQRTPSTAREKVELLVDSLQDLVESVKRDPDAGLALKVQALKALTGPIRLLGTFTGEIGASEANVAKSPFYRRVRTALLEALRPHPDAARAVIDALERVERGASESSEAAA